MLLVFVACGAASRLRLKQALDDPARGLTNLRRMWSGFSSEIETSILSRHRQCYWPVACGAASRLRLKHTGRLRPDCPHISSHVERLLV